MSDDIVVNMNFNLGKDQTVADIVTLLRKYQPYNKLHGQAANEIERLRAEVARLNTFLHPIGVVINREVRGD